VGYANHIIQHYGVREFIADIEADRLYWRDADHCVCAVLDWAASEGFADFFGQDGFDVDAKTGLEYRQRHLLRAFKLLKGGV